jgi:hypothetical protein
VHTTALAIARLEADAIISHLEVTLFLDVIVPAENEF